MSPRSIILALAGGVLFWFAHAGPAWSQPIQGFYLGAGAGVRTPFPIKSSSHEPGVGGEFDLNQSVGYDTQFSLGYAIGDGWRFELEGTLGQGNVKSVSGTSFPAAGSGTVRNSGVMMNALFDLDVRSPYVFPYLGLGLGYQSTRLSGVMDTAAGKPGAFTLSGVTSSFAAQAIAGLSFPIPNMPGLSLTLDYRVIDILGGGSYGGTSSIGLAAGSAPVAGSAKIHNQFDQSAMFGVRYAFNTPPPAAVASIAPSAEARTYQVVFDADKTTLSDRAQTTVRNAALASTRQGTTSIAVTANERVAGGSARDASDRRANAVIATLIASGVPRESIFVVADSGEAGDRRVEIVTR